MPTGDEASPKRTLKVSIALVAMIILLLWTIGRQLMDSLAWGHESWQLSEWLINYSGGFVRRGLNGFIIGVVATATRLQANHLVIFASLLSYVALAMWFLRRSTKIFPAALILSGILIGLPGYEDAIIRKDSLGLLLLVGCIKARNSTLPLLAKFLLFNGLASFAILSHETFIFYALPAFLFYEQGTNELPMARRLLNRAAFILPSISCFILTIIFHGNPQIAETINDSWMPLWQITNPQNAAIQDAATAIQAVGWNSGQGLSLGLTLLTSGIYQPAAWAIVFAISFGLVVLFTGRDTFAGDTARTELKIRITALLICQLIVISPLFILGVDYGRWLYFWIGSSVIFQAEDISAPGWLRFRIQAAFQRFKIEKIVTRIPARDWYLLFFGVPVCWNIHNFVFASPVARHLEILSSWFTGIAPG